MWVYLSDGRVLEIRNATTCRILAGCLVLYMEKQMVATFRRRDVVYCSEAPACPVSFN
jgi:hypothetical protein